MDSQTGRLLLMMLKTLEQLDTQLHGLWLTLDNASARALATEGALNELLPDFKERYDKRYAGIQAHAKPRSIDSSLEEIRKAIDTLN